MDARGPTTSNSHETLAIKGGTDPIPACILSIGTSCAIQLSTTQGPAMPRYRAGIRDNATKSGKPGHNRDIGPNSRTVLAKQGHLATMLNYIWHNYMLASNGRNL